MRTQAREHAPTIGPKKYQITFVWPNDDWTWIDVEANDFHQAMLIALDKCPLNCRVQRIEVEPEGKSFTKHP